MIDVQVGDIVFSGNRKKSFYSNAVMFFTNSKWSHCFFIMTDVANERAAFEADLKCQVVPWIREYGSSDNDYYEVYRPIKASNDEKIAAANHIYMEYSGEIYGFMQIPWFIWDALCKKIGWDAGKNWFPSGVICSESLNEYIHKLNKLYNDAFNSESDMNRASPEDLYLIVKKHPELFEYVGKRE